jgi:hypothetical protein
MRFDVLRWIRHEETTKDLHVVVMTGSEGVNAANRGYKMGPTHLS